MAQPALSGPAQVASGATVWVWSVARLRRPALCAGSGVPGGLESPTSPPTAAFGWGWRALLRRVLERRGGAGPHQPEEAIHARMRASGKRSLRARSGRSRGQFSSDLLVDVRCRVFQGHGRLPAPRPQGPAQGIGLAQRSGRVAAVSWIAPDVRARGSRGWGRSDSHGLRHAPAGPSPEHPPHRGSSAGFLRAMARKPACCRLFRPDERRLGPPSLAKRVTERSGEVQRKPRGIPQRFHTPDAARARATGASSPLHGSKSGRALRAGPVDRPR
jgi:hypothetical protein